MATSSISGLASGLDTASDHQPADAARGDPPDPAQLAGHDREVDRPALQAINTNAALLASKAEALAKPTAWQALTATSSNAAVGSPPRRAPAPTSLSLESPRSPAATSSASPTPHALDRPSSPAPRPRSPSTGSTAPPLSLDTGDGTSAVSRRRSTTRPTPPACAPRRSGSARASTACSSSPSTTGPGPGLRPHRRGRLPPARRRHRARRLRRHRSPSAARHHRHQRRRHLHRPAARHYLHPRLARRRSATPRPSTVTRDTAGADRQGQGARRRAERPARPTSTPSPRPAPAPPRPACSPATPAMRTLRSALLISRLPRRRHLDGRARHPGHPRRQARARRREVRRRVRRRPRGRRRRVLLHRQRFRRPAQTVAKSASDSTTGTVTAAITGRKSGIDRLETDVEDWDLRLELRRTTLTRQFTALETALGQMTNQSSWLAGQISSLPTYN